MNEKFEKYLEKDVSRIWTPDEFFYELNRDILDTDLLTESFLENASDKELLTESLALFAMLGVSNAAGKIALDALARKYKFAAMSSAMIWMKKMGITTRCNVGGSMVRMATDSTTKNPKAGEVIFRDFYEALKRERSKPNSPVTINPNKNTYSWIVFSDVNKQQTGNRLEFYIDNDADPLGKKVSELTVRVEWKGLQKDTTEVIGNEKKASGAPEEKKAPAAPAKALPAPQKALPSPEQKESFSDMSFLSFLLEAEAEVTQEKLLNTKSRLPLTQFVSLAMKQGSNDPKNFVFGEFYYDACSNAANNRPDADKDTADKEAEKQYDAEKKPGKRKSYNKKGVIEACWEVDMYGTLNVQGKASILSRLTKVLFGGIGGGTGDVMTAMADTVTQKLPGNFMGTPMTPFKFGFIHGDFIVPPMKLKSMYNFPRFVRGNMEVQGNQITTCAWCPVVKKTLDMTDNKLMSAWGIRPAVNREVILTNNPMKSLYDTALAPKWVQKPDFAMKSLQTLDLSGCENLVDLKGVPKDITDELNLSYTGITYDSLKELVGLKTERLDISHCENVAWTKTPEGKAAEGKGEETKSNEEETGTNDQKLLTTDQKLLNAPEEKAPKKENP